MDLDHLRNFMAVVEQGSISMAAHLQRMSQPALSRQLQALEREMQAALLVRHPWGVAPTPAGKILAARGRQVFDEMRLAREEISVATKAPAGELSVGISGSAASILAQVISTARRKLPQVEVRYYEANSVTLQNRLVSRELDIALLQPLNTDVNFRAHLTIAESMIAVGAAGQFRPDQPVSLTEVFQHDILAITRHGRMRVLFEKFSAKRRTTSFLEVDSYLAVLELLAAGEGVALLPYSMVRDSAESGRISWAPIRPQPWTRTLILARHHERLVTPAVQALVDIIHDVARQHEDAFKWTVRREVEA